MSDFASELAAAAEDVISTSGVAATTVTITEKSRTSYSASTGKRVETTGSTVTDISATRSRQTLRSTNGATLEAVVYRVRAADLSFTPAGGDLLQDAASAAARRIVAASLAACGTVYDIVVEAVHGEA